MLPAFNPDAGDTDKDYQPRISNIGDAGCRYRRQCIKSATLSLPPGNWLNLRLYVGPDVCRRGAGWGLLK